MFVSPSPRSVKPSRLTYKHRDLIVTDGIIGMTEQGEHIPDIGRYLELNEALIVVTTDAGKLLKTCELQMGNDPCWQYKAARTLSGDGKVESTRLERLGLTGGGRKNPNRSHKAMHIVWSPFEMQKSTKPFLTGNDFGSLLRWALDFRAYHKELNLNVGGTFGSVAAKMLRHPRFYPDDRRRVPRATNERARDFLPGVHQTWHGERMTRYDVTAMDQSRAYHYIAQEIAMPDANTLYARGFYSDPFNKVRRLWAPVDSTLYNRIVKQQGLFFVRGSFSGNPKFSLPCLTRGRNVYALWSNELDFAVELGLKVEGFTAALTSTDPEPDGIGLSVYGEYALDAINSASPERAAWLKPTLHATYGMLATRPRPMTFAFRQAKGGTDVDYFIGGQIFPVKERVTEKEMQPSFANLVQFGMLQAEVRKRTLRLARELESYGCTVTHTHADGLHVAGQLPLTIPSNWTLEPRTDLRYLDGVSWVSREKDCLPGRTPEQAKRARLAALPLGPKTEHGYQYARDEESARKVLSQSLTNL